MSSINKIKPGEIGVFATMTASGPVIIQKRDGVLKTLLVKHGDRSVAELKWKFCGGKVIPGQSLEERAIGKAQQEIGVTVKLIRPLKPMILWQEIPEKGNEKPQVIILIHYLAEISEEPKMGEGTLAMDWFDIHDLPADSAPNVKPVIAEYLATNK